MNRANLAVLAVIVLAGCQAPKPTTSTGGGALAYSYVLKMRSDSFQRMDTNHDCALSHQEWSDDQTRANPSASPWEGDWHNRDRDGDGYQTAEEWLGKDAYGVSPCKGVSPPPGLPPSASPSPSPSPTPSGSPSPVTPSAPPTGFL
jgi:hypothetical protein